MLHYIVQNTENLWKISSQFGKISQGREGAYADYWKRKNDHTGRIQRFL